jgi:hypothetical protein
MTNTNIDLPALDQAVAELGEAVKTFTATQTDANLKYQVYTAARKVMTVTQNPDDQWLWHSVNMSELAAIATFMRWKAFDKIPADGSISYKELAETCDASEGLTSETSGTAMCVG